MIGVRLMGGLGNQMFQYAVARRLARDLRTSVALDTALLENPPEVGTPRRYELDGFDALNARILARGRRPAEDSRADCAGRRGRWRSLRDRVAGRAWKIYRERQYNYDPAVLALPDRSYLMGYWQTERYFASIRAQLLEEFGFHAELSDAGRAFLEAIDASFSVSIHVRRGDYVSDPGARRVYGALGLDYYRRALRPILKRGEAPRLFVFSDDPGWCKRNLMFDHDTVVVEGTMNGHEDMRLMSRCKHNVIANSSFSWWAAWLNENRAKLIVAPKGWFLPGNVNACDLVPASWLTA